MFAQGLEIDQAVSCPQNPKRNHLRLRSESFIIDAGLLPESFIMNASVMVNDNSLNLFDLSC